MYLHSATTITKQPLDDPGLTIDLHQDWADVSLGPDFKVTACIVAGHILLTRSSGFGKAPDMDRYVKFILKVMAESPVQDQPYVHVMDWRHLKGGSNRARNKIASFLQNQSQLRGLVICGAKALLRMSTRVTERFFAGFPPTHFCADINSGIQLASDILQLDLPDDNEQMPVLVEEGIPEYIASSLHQRSENHNHISYALDISDNHQLEFQRIGNSVLYCRIKGSLPLSSLNIANILQKRHQAILQCMGRQSIHVEIWDCSNFFRLIGSVATRQLFKTLYNSSLPLLGCILIDADRRIRKVAYRRFLGRLAPFPVHMATSLTSALLKAQEYLLKAGYTLYHSSPPTETHLEWTFDDGDFRAENQIVDGRIIHTICRGPLTVSRVQRTVEFVRSLALKVVGSGNPYYLVAGVAELSGGSYVARKAFAGEVRELYREMPFRMCAIYGAKGILLASINLSRHKLPFRMHVADHFEDALTAIQVDQYVHTHLSVAGNFLLPIHNQQNSHNLKQYVDDILQYLGTVDWESNVKSAKLGFADSRHPFAQVFDAIDVLKEDLAVLYHEQQKAAQEQLELEAQLARSRKMEALGLLAGGVAHDLNNVLSGIVTYPDVLLMELPENSPMYEPLCRIRKSGKKAAAIVQDLLTLTRRGVNNATTLNINTLIEEYLRSPEHQTLTTHYPEIAVETNLSSDVMNMRGSAMHIKKTIMNLVYNAFEASMADTNVELLTENRFVNSPKKGYETIPRGEYVVLHIIDHGSGIADTDLPRIFEPFYTKKRMGRSGTGLGMAVVWGTMQDHHGYIDIKTAPGGGTTFYLYFPASKAKINARSVKNEQLPISGHGELILVVDDMKEQRDFASAVLNLLNYQIKTAGSGEEALAYLRREHADLVLLDMIMDPGMDGLDTLQQIRKSHPGLPVIIATGYADNERIDNARKLCDGQIVRKPYTVQTLGEAILKALHTQWN